MRRFGRLDGWLQVLVAAGLVSGCRQVLGIEGAGLGYSPDGGVGGSGGSVTDHGGSGGASTTRSNGLLANGQSCGGKTQCSSGNCIDGFCCDGPCTGACQACDIGGHQGHCTTLPSGQPPHNLRPACSNAGTPPCGGQCDGVSSACSYPPVSVICGAACNGTCDGNGKCSVASSGACPGGYACGAGSCKTSCTRNSDCQTNFACDPDAGGCSRVPESDCFDNVDNNGDGLTDCEDPTCTPIAECVANPDAGLMGNLTTGACAANFAAGVGVYQGLADGTCATSMCSCAAQVDCPIEAVVYSTSVTACDTTIADWFLPPDGGCRAVGLLVGATGAEILRHGSAQSSSCACRGSASAPTPSWAAANTFCPVLSEGTCATPGLVCVPKPSAGPMCVRLPVGSSCPAGYTVGSEWFTGYSLGNCTCGNPTPSNVSCTGTSGLVRFYPDSACGSNTYGDLNAIGPGFCTQLFNSEEQNGSPISPGGVGTFNVQSMAVLDGGGTATCTPIANLDASVPTGGITLCCPK